MNSKITHEFKEQCILCSTGVNYYSGQKCQKGLHALLRCLQMDVSDAQENVPICIRCSIVINQFHVVYQTCELSRLKLDQSLQSIREDMKTGYDSDILDKNIPQQNQPDMNTLVKITRLRKMLLESCDDRMKRCMPRVFLSKVQTFSRHTRSTCVPVKKPGKQVTPSLILVQPKLTSVTQVTRSQSEHSGVTNRKLYKCKYCNKVCHDNDGLTQHTYGVHIVTIVSSHLPAHVTQKECYKGITQVFEKIHKTDKKFNCSYCNYTCTSRRIRTHMTYFHLDNFVRDVHSQLHLPQEGCQPFGHKSPQLEAVEETTSLPVSPQPLPPVVNVKKVTSSPNKYACPHCPSKFHSRHGKRSHLVQMHTSLYIFNLLSKPSIPCQYSIDTISAALAHVFKENESKFLAISAARKSVQCPFCVTRARSSKRHVLDAHFGIFMTSVKERLEIIEQQGKDNLDLNPSLDWTLPPVSISGTLLNEVMQATEENNLNFGDIFSTINDLDFN